MSGALLIDAARAGDVSQVELLLGAAWGAEDLGRALYEAVRFGHEVAAMSLHLAGATPWVRDESGNTAVHLAAGQGMHDLVRALATSSPEQTATWNRDGLTPAGIAVMEGDVVMVRLLLEVGCEPMPERLLPLAGCAGDLVIGSMLLDRGLPIDARDHLDRTCLHWAAQQGHVDMVDMLLRHGADARLRDAEGDDALAIAVCESPDIAALLLDRAGVDWRSCSPGALRLAAMYGDLDTVRRLLDVGYGAEDSDEDGDTPLSLARAAGRGDVVPLLESVHSNG